MMRRHLIKLALVLTAMCCVLLVRTVTAADADLLTAIRDDDISAVRRLLTSGANPDARDDLGATALMHAAAFSSLDGLRALLDKGADVSASTPGGATALMWAVGDVAKVQLLLDRGAAVNASMKDGTTALLAAARRGNVEVMRLLLDRKADTGTSANARAELLRIVSAERPEARQTVASAGIDVKSLVTPGPATLANYPVSATSALRELLDLGADPNPRGRFPLIGLAAFDSRIDTVKLLLDHGADPNARGQHDATSLMMAAAALRPDPAIARLLIERGTDIDARDDAGRTALDWALLQGETPVAQLLRRAGTKTGETIGPPAPAAKPRSARDAVVAAIAQLQRAGPVLYKQRQCVSCHHQALPAMAMKLAGARGIAVDAEAATHPIRSTLAVWRGRRDALMVSREVGGGANELTYGLLMLAEAGVPRDSTTDVAVANLIGLQRGDGTWVFADTRPPQADNSPIHFTAMAVRALNFYTPPGLRDDIQARVERARQFLRSAEPTGTQDEAFKLLGLVWSRAPAPEIALQTKRLLALQRADGGWAQLPTMTPDAYATGQALYALQVSRAPIAGRAYQSGVAYLLRTQLDDGTWFVRSRAFGFQPYFESGFPHGRDQFISASATAWAVIALAHAL
jgi:ankyrin repeat protein